MIEKWKDVKNYEGLYQISNLGRIKSLNYNRSKQEGILTPQKDKVGYLHVRLAKDGKITLFKVHRLVATHFLNNPENLPIINHKNEIKTDNRADNLEWVTFSYNLNYGGCQTRRIKKIQKKIICTTTGIIFDSLSEASKETGINISGICRCCQKKAKTAGKLIWNYFF